jgi:eukaryotic-like serine/threonine-protein kinase
VLAGRPPFEGDSPADTVARVRQAEPVRPTKYQLSVPGLFEGAVLKMLAKRTDDRYQTAAELLTDLQRVARFQTTPCGAFSPAGRWPLSSSC